MWEWEWEWDQRFLHELAPSDAQLARDVGAYVQK